MYVLINSNRFSYFSLIEIFVKCEFQIIKLLDAWRDDTALYFAQEMGTCNLQEYLEGNPIQSMDEVARLSAQIFSGVHHIHKLQIIHAV
uniref:Protein kinase domain-containing protein n=1 Tax=Panagrolaimus davidi TaxID=227884 RepID=A0A914QIB9_9BILA